MRNILIASALLAGFAAPALADGRELRCTQGVDGQSVSVSQIGAALEEQGYRIDRVKDRHGCYAFRLVNDSQYPIEAVYAPSNGELLRARLR